MPVSSLGESLERYLEKLLDGSFPEIIRCVLGAHKMAARVLVSGVPGSAAQCFFMLAPHVVGGDFLRYDPQVPSSALRWCGFNVRMRELRCHCPSPAPI